jgi:hypothetical protein
MAIALQNPGVCMPPPKFIADLFHLCKYAAEQLIWQNIFYRGNSPLRQEEDNRQPPAAGMVFATALFINQSAMQKDNDPTKIIGNESNNEYVIEPGTTRTLEPNATESNNKLTQPLDNAPTGEVPPINNDLATNDGSVVETLDTAFHNKPGVAEGENPSGSDRADYYEAHEQGKSDAEQEADSLSRKSH